MELFSVLFISFFSEDFFELPEFRIKLILFEDKIFESYFFGVLFMVIFRLSILYIFLNILGIGLFSLYLIYDIQLIEGNQKYKLSEDDYILGVIMLYLDIINLFLYILSFFVKNN